MSVKHGETTLAIATVIAAGTCAYSDVVRHENDGSFRFGQQMLDITLRARDQVSFHTAAEHAIELSTHIDKYFTTTALADRVEPGDLGAVEFWSGPGTGLSVSPIESGDLIGPDLTNGRWLGISNFVRVEYPSDYYGEGGTFSPLDAGEPAYIGLRVDLAYGDGFRYGWVGVIWDPDSTDGANFLDVFAWGYETDAGESVGAGVPSPGGLALLAFGAVGAMSARRR